MAEREPARRPWNVGTITEFLKVSPETTEDIAFGAGQRFRLSTAPDATSVELFASASAARITTVDMQLTLRRIAAQVQGGELVFAPKTGAQQRQRASVSASGEVTVIPNADVPSVEPGTAAITETANLGERSAREATLEQAIRMLVDALDRCGGDEPTCPHCGPARAFAEGLVNPLVEEAQRPQPEQERLTVTGRIGAELSFRTTRNGVLIARFPVAVHRDDGGTTWETVVVFGKKAERLRGALQKGQTVEVVGYAHDRRVPKRDGTVKTVREIYGTVVRTR